MGSSSVNLVAVHPDCLAAAGLPAHKARYFARSADRVADGLLIFNTGLAIYAAHADLFAGCTSAVPTEAAVAAVKAMEPPPRPKREGFPLWTGYDGSKRWAKLHGELHPTPETVERVIAETCFACQPHARALLADIPPEFSGLDEYRRWSVRYHAAVSASIGQPTFTYAQAASRWGW